MKVLKIRVNFSSAEVAEIENQLRLEFGPFVVSPERAEELKDILALADEDIEEHDTEMARLQSELMLVQTQKRRLETQRDKLRALLSPMRRLSNEILLSIFEYVCEENLFQVYPWASGQQRSTELTSPVITCLPTMAISSVCSRWRTLALSSPRLWANLAVEMHTATLDLAKTPVGFIDTVTRYLERSGDWPLRFALTILGVPYDTKFASLKYFTQHARRWKSFTYRGYYLLMEYGILSELQFPSLVELDIDSRGDFFNSPDLQRFEYSPRLATLCTDSIPVSKFPYNQVDCLYLRMGSASPTELAEALRSCPSVKSLTVELKYEKFSDSSAQGTWRNITSLAVGESGDKSCAGMVFSSFDFPSLDELQLEVQDSAEEPTTWPGDAFISFVSRSSCTITTFTLRGLSLSDLELIAALQVMPSLLNLEIDDAWLDLPDQRSPITLHLISSLQHQSTFISLIPKLHSLRLISRLSQRFDDHAFVSMVQSRWFKPGSDLCAAMLAIGRGCIRSVVLEFGWREVDAKVYEPLRVLDGAGLRVVVSGINGVQV